MNKVSWSGTVVGVQPRIDLTRSFDQRQHSYLGYLLRLTGEVQGVAREFTVRVGPGAQAKHRFRAGMRISGAAVPVGEPEREVAEFYKASALKVDQPAGASPPSPPWLDEPPALAVYRERGHRRLDARTYEAHCRACLWGCRMAVTMIVDQWNPSQRRYRFETFCYGPKSCPLYRAGATRKVPGRRGMTWEEEDWIDADATAHRAPDE